MGSLIMKVLGEKAVAKFARKHPASCQPLARFIDLALQAKWQHFPAMRESFPSADYAPATGSVIFDIGANKHGLTARIDFEEQLLYIQDVLTHEEYDREKF
jgi:mRNA interferase HigB